MTSCEPCMRDGKQTNARFSCRNCEEALCFKCRRDHTKFRQFVDHEIVELKTSLNQLLRDGSAGVDSHNPSYRKSKDVRGQRVAQQVTSVDVKSNNNDVECPNRCQPSRNADGYIDVTSEDKSFVNRKYDDDVDDDMYIHPVSGRVNLPEPRHFPVFQVLENDLARKTGIGGHNGYIIVTSGHVIFASNQSCVSIDLSIIRKFSVGTKPRPVFQIEVGRRFRHGEGMFEFATSVDEAWSLYHFCNETAHNKAQPQPRCS